MRSLFLSSLLLCALWAGASADTCVVLPPMPASGQYPSLAQYQEAFQAWQSMAKSLIARSGQNVQPPPMPQPYQYRSFQQYQEALRIWQDLFK